jgi:hypothetical protein
MTKQLLEFNMTFRHWLSEMWLNHKDEYIDIGQPVPEVNLAQYFQTYKYWLKREYRHQQGSING